MGDGCGPLGVCVGGERWTGWVWVACGPRDLPGAAWALCCAGWRACFVEGAWPLLWGKQNKENRGCGFWELRDRWHRDWGGAGLSCLALCEGCGICT